MSNQSNKNQFILDIPKEFIKMIGIRNYKNPNNKQEEDINIQSIVDDLTPHGLLILTAIINENPYKDRYNLSIELQNRMNEMETVISDKDVDGTISLKIKVDKTHNIKQEDNLENVSFNIYTKNLELNDRGFVIAPPRIYFKNFVYFDDYTSEDVSMFDDYRFKINKKGGFYEKYMKYKDKYLRLKSKI